GGMSGMRGEGGGRPGFDPNQMFDMMSKGKDIVNRADLDPMMAGMFDRFAGRMGITNGQMTRQQFSEYMQQRMAGRGGRPGSSGGAPPGSPAPSGSPSFGGGRPGMGGMGGQDPTAAWAEGMFRRLDQNGDGLLNNDEMPESLRIERDKWDTNKDGFIDLNEFKEFFKAAVQKRMEENSFLMNGNGSTAPADPVHEEEPKPVVYRAGKLPKELPSWFTQIDTDGDGQISLYEWRSAGKSVEEFQKMDRNGDGYLTIAEVLYYTQGKNNLNGVAIVAATPAKNGDTHAPGSSAPGGMTFD